MRTGVFENEGANLPHLCPSKELDESMFRFRVSGSVYLLLSLL